MSLNHDFLLLDRSTDPPENYGRHIHSCAALQLHDDHVQYILDALSWIPTENPATRDGNGMGLNLYGPTVISQRGARKLQEVCSALALLFASGPETLDLQGSYGWVGDDPGSGHYERLSVARDELVGKLSKLGGNGRQFPKRVCASPGYLAAGTCEARRRTNRIEQMAQRALLTGPPLLCNRYKA